jgi:hypothetical protein
MLQVVHAPSNVLDSLPYDACLRLVDDLQSPANASTNGIGLFPMRSSPVVCPVHLAWWLAKAVPDLTHVQDYARCIAMLLVMCSMMPKLPCTTQRKTRSWTCALSSHEQ